MNKNKAITILATAAILILPGGITISIAYYIINRLKKKP